MSIPPNKNTICWYCAKACDCTQCTISKGKKPKCAIKESGNIVECKNFVRDVPKPMSIEEFEKRFNIPIQKVRYYRYSLFRAKKFFSYRTKILNAIKSEKYSLELLKQITSKRHTFLHRLSVCVLFKRHHDPLNYDKTHYYKYFSAINKPYYFLLNKMQEYINKEEQNNYVLDDNLLEIKNELKRLL